MVAEGESGGVFYDLDVTSVEEVENNKGVSENLEATRIPNPGRQDSNTPKGRIHRFKEHVNHIDAVKGEIAKNNESDDGDSTFSANMEIAKEMADIKADAVADGSFMKAPNGKPSNLNERQWLQVRTAAFKDWFGDWEKEPENVSKVVDENGEPLVVYHGTEHPVPFSVFKSGKSGYLGPGIYFTPELRGALQYRGFYDPESGMVYSCFVNMRKPLRISYAEKPAKVILDMVSETAYESRAAVQANESKMLRKGDLSKVKRKGYDGIVWMPKGAYDANSFTSGEMLLFDSTQIKSATDNRGTFDGSNADITFSMERNLAAVHTLSRAYATDSKGNVLNPDTFITTPYGNLDWYEFPKDEKTQKLLASKNVKSLPIRLRVGKQYSQLHKGVGFMHILSHVNDFERINETPLLHLYNTLRNLVKIRGGYGGRYQFNGEYEGGRDSMLIAQLLEDEGCYSIVSCYPTQMNSRPQVGELVIGRVLFQFVPSSKESQIQASKTQDKATTSSVSTNGQVSGGKLPEDLQKVNIYDLEIRDFSGKLIYKQPYEPHVTFSMRTKEEPKKKGIGYKVFYQKDGKLYPPMVANPGEALVTFSMVHVPLYHEILDTFEQRLSKDNKAVWVSRKSGNKMFRICSYPDVLNAITPWMDNVLANAAVIKKLMNKHHMLPQDVAKLPHALWDPIAVFEDPKAKNHGGFIVVSDIMALNNEGEIKHVMVVLELKADKHNAVITDVKSAYSADKTDKYAALLDKGYLRYVDKERALMWASAEGDSILQLLTTALLHSGSGIILKENMPFVNTNFSASMEKASLRALEVLRTRADEREGERLMNDWQKACEGWAQLHVGGDDSRLGNGAKMLGEIHALIGATKGVLPEKYARMGHLNGLLRWAAVYANMQQKAEAMYELNARNFVLGTLYLVLASSLSSVLGEIAVADREGGVAVEHIAVVATGRRCHVAEGGAGVEEVLQIVGAGVA